MHTHTPTHTPTHTYATPHSKPHTRAHSTRVQCAMRPYIVDPTYTHCSEVMMTMQHDHDDDEETVWTVVRLCYYVITCASGIDRITTDH